MNIPTDLTVDIRQGEIRLQSGGKTVTIDHRSLFRDGPLTWRVIMLAIVTPALWQFEQQAADLAPPPAQGAGA